MEDRASFAIQQVLGMDLKLVKVDPTVANVPSARCEACHSSDIKRKTTDARGLRIRHATCAVNRQCTDCHSATAHGTAISWPRTVSMEMCFDCHGANNVTAKCDACHSGKRPNDRIKTGPFAVTHGANYLKTHGMGNMKTCVACHDSSTCGKCHGAGLPHKADFLSQHSAFATSSDAKCSGCHKQQFCSGCHVYQMPHPTTFVSSHAKLVDKNGEKGCTKCHQKADCNNCHLAHVHPTKLEELKNMGVGGTGRAK